MATNAQRRLAEREQERIRDDAGRKAAWAFLWVLFAFKIVTVAVIWWAATSTHSAELDFIIATTWYWFLIPIAAISGPILLRWRLVRMRRRREALRSAEWDNEDEAESFSLDDILAQQHRNGA